jgi:AcrR family transcriptional regulator
VRSSAVRPRTRREHLGAESRARILAAASALMTERGFSGTSISAVSERSGLPSSSIYWHFGSKEGLLAAVVEEGAQRWFDGLPRWEALEGRPLERGRQMMEATARALETHPEFLRLLFLIALERRDIDADSLAAIARVRGMARKGLERTADAILAAAGLPDPRPVAAETASLALAMIDGIFLQHHIEPAATDVPRLFALAHAALLGLGERLLREIEPDRDGSSHRHEETP